MSLLLLLLACGGRSDDDSVSTTAGTGGGDTEVSSIYDPLSMPAEPTVSLDDFESAASCEACHPNHYAEWRRSSHAYSMVDPIYRSLVSLRRDHQGDAPDIFCTQCHSAIGARSGDIQPGFSFDELAALTNEGITCEACHKVSDIERSYNSGHVIDATGPIRGQITDPVETYAHESEGSELFEDARFCGACHDVIEMNGLPLERPYEEWTTSPAAEAGENCQSCHMPTSSGPAAHDGPDRTLHSHTWVGVDVPLLEGFVTEEERSQIRDEVEALLQSAGTVTLALPEAVTIGEQVDVVVSVFNDITAHNLPTGSTFLRQCWLEVVATDADGDVLFITGDLDANGDLRDHWSDLDPYGDHDLVVFHSGLLDEDANPTVFTHYSQEHRLSAIPPLYERTYTFFVPTAAAAAGELIISARLRFRAFPPFLLRLLGFDDYINQIEIFDIDVIDGTVTLQ